MHCVRIFAFQFNTFESGGMASDGSRGLFADIPVHLKLCFALRRVSTKVDIGIAAAWKAMPTGSTVVTCVVLYISRQPERWKPGCKI